MLPQGPICTIYMNKNQHMWGIKLITMYLHGNMEDSGNYFLINSNLILTTPA